MCAALADTTWVVQQLSLETALKAADHSLAALLPTIVIHRSPFSSRQSRRAERSVWIAANLPCSLEIAGAEGQALQEGACQGSFPYAKLRRLPRLRVGPWHWRKSRGTDGNGPSASRDYGEVTRCVPHGTNVLVEGEPTRCLVRTGSACRGGDHADPTLPKPATNVVSPRQQSAGI